MWLFDDLIKKPTPPTDSSAWQGGATGQTGTSGQGGYNPPQPDTPESEQWAKNQISLDPQPTYTSPDQTSGGVDPLMTSQGEKPIVIQKSSEESILTEKPITRPPETPLTPKPTENVADDASLLIVWNEGTTPVAPVMVVAAETPAAPVVVQNPVIAAESTTEKQSLRDLQLNRMIAGSETTSQISSQDDTILNNLFSSEPTPLVEATAVEPVQVETLTAEEIEKDADKVAESFENPLTFIEASIKRIDGMIAHIEETHTAKLDEAAAYKAEKERNAGLEADCYAAAEKMMKEHAHAEKMKKYFISQRDQADEQSSSIETTLTTLVVKKNVDEATEIDGKKHGKKQKEDAQIA